ncbi:MAG: hypothetical protein VW516_13020 [Rhodospirillaceae bacterium]|jgi:hypothetical protein
MTWIPSEPIRASLLDFQLPRRFFIEQDETTIDDRTGWATPRRRPRRIHKKLAARAFQARCRGAVAGRWPSETKCHHWHGRAPHLAVWLRGGWPRGAGWPQDLKVLFEPVAFDGLTIAQPMHPESVLATGRFLVAKHPPSVIRPYDKAAPIGPITRETEEWRGQAMAFVMEAQMRRVTGTVVVFTPPGTTPTSAVVNAPMKRAMNQIVHAMLRAAQGEHESTVIARQTSYRPTRGASR